MSGPDLRTVYRWVLLVRHRDKYDTLLRSAQGRYTYETEQEAQEQLTMLVLGNHKEKLDSIFGEDSSRTMRVAKVACWAGHHDPVATVYPPLEETQQ